VDAAAPLEKRYVLWDTALQGFGLCIAPSGLKTFVLRYRARHRFAPKRFINLGKYGPVTAEEARRKATQYLGEVADGKDPAFETQQANLTAITFADACDRFLHQHVKAKRKANTVSLYEHLIENKIQPFFGNRHFKKVSKQEVAQFHDSLKDTPVLANRAVGVLAALYAWAGRTGLIEEGFNPATRVEKFRELPKDRYLTMAEINQLGQALREAETVGIAYDIDTSSTKSKHAAKPENRMVIYSPFAVAAIRLLILTGCRVGEILNLRWREVDLERGLLHLPDSKTGRKVVLLGAAAVKIIDSLPRVGEYVIFGINPDQPRSDLKRPWDAIRGRAGIKDVRLHDLRHSFASVGAGAGLGLPIIGKLLGHSQPRTTAKYAHLADDPMRRAVEEVSSTIAEKLSQ
jgi:integrase